MSSSAPLALRLHDVAMPSPRPVPLLRGGWIAAGLAINVLLDIVLLVAARLPVAVSAAGAGFGLAGLAAAVVCYALRAPVTRGQRVARDLTEGVALFAVVSLLCAVASYPLATRSHDFVDRELERIDLSLHFHWTSWYELVARHPWLQLLERTAYLSIFMTPALLIVYFAWTGRRAECRLFVATFWVAALTTLALFPFVPAAGPLMTLWHGAMPYIPLCALYQDQVVLLALRHHEIHAIDLGALHGLVCAPSFHAASAVIYIVTAARIGPLRWPLAIVNAAMLLATPIEGMHYLADLLSGVAVALFALTFTPIMIGYTRRLDRR